MSNSDYIWTNLIVNTVYTEEQINLVEVEMKSTEINIYFVFQL